MKTRHLRAGRWIAATLLALAASAGCSQRPPQYGVEEPLYLAASKREVWAIAPALNLSGQREVDPLLQADMLYQQMQQVNGVTVVPVNRVAEAYVGLGIEKVTSAEQAALVCDVLGCDALVVPTVTAYDPYDPPKLGASLQMFRKPGSFARPAGLDVRELSRMATPAPDESLPAKSSFLQAVGMFDAANGSTRDALFRYAAGRNDPLGPLAAREYLVSMDRYCGFVYHQLTEDLVKRMRDRKKPVAKAKAYPSN